MRNGICFSALMLGWVTIAHGDFVLKQTVENFGQRQQVTIKLKGSKCRIDTSGDTSALIDPQTGTVILLHQPKMFMPISSEQLSAQAEAVKKMLAASVNSNENTDFQSTGKTDNISGFATEEYTAKIDGLPITLDVTKNFPKYRELLAQLYAVQDAPGLSPFHTLSVPPEKYPGLPVRTTIEMLGQKIVTTLDTVEETTLAEADFAIPADYQELRAKSQPQSSPQSSP